MRFTRSGAHRYMRFLDEGGAVIDRYAYRYDSGADPRVLSLRLVNTNEWMDLEAGDPFCEAAPDCNLQGIVRIGCRGSWSCEANACEFTCAPSCADSGGTCMQPSECDDKGGDVDTGPSCFGADVGAKCCMPPQTCADVGGLCRQPSWCLSNGGETQTQYSCGSPSFGAVCCVQ